MKKILAVGIVLMVVLLCAEGLPYKQFKQGFQVAALQCGVPFTLADSLIQKGTRAATIQVFFTKNSDINIFMTPDLIITELTVNISGEKNDIKYAYATLWALENFQTQKEAEQFLQKIMAQKVGERLLSESGFRYSHPELTGSAITFTAKNTKIN